tara:strand:+ start:550 stop:1665 length:1116 start_codon:yes stop_codon:yes gene_type:complete
VKPLLHIVEPTLANQAGHCFNHTQSLVNANHSLDIQLWIDNRGTSLFQDSECSVQGWFSRRWRKFQLAGCYIRCLREGGGVFVPTAGQLDMWILDILQRLGVGRGNDSTVILHFHQFNQTRKKERRLRVWAQRHPEWHILATTERLLRQFREVGFRQCAVVHYPAVIPTPPESSSGGTPRLLYAGALRDDKGFSRVAEYLEFLVEQRVDWPTRVQCSPPSFKSTGEMEQGSANALMRLRALDYPKLELIDRTLPMAEYHSLFQDAICLQLYDRVAYGNKISAVALEALYLGSPLITVSDTWMGDVVTKYGAGVVLDELSNATIHDAVQHVREDFPAFQKRAQAAGQALARLHDPRATLCYLESAIKFSTTP